MRDFDFKRYTPRPKKLLRDFFGLASYIPGCDQEFYAAISINFFDKLATTRFSLSLALFQGIFDLAFVSVSFPIPSILSFHLADLFVRLSVLK